jgi:cation transport ATPase
VDISPPSAGIAGAPDVRPRWRPGATLRRVVEHRAPILATGALAAILVGGILHAAALLRAGDAVWQLAVAILASALLAEVVDTVVADHHMGVDSIALVAMVGALALGQELAGAVVGLMFSGGQAIEDLASTRARRELTALVSRAPKFAHRRSGT